MVKFQYLHIKKLQNFKIYVKKLSNYYDETEKISRNYKYYPRIRYVQEKILI